MALGECRSNINYSLENLNLTGHLGKLKANDLVTNQALSKSLSGQSPLPHREEKQLLWLRNGFENRRNLPQQLPCSTVALAQSPKWKRKASWETTFLEEASNEPTDHSGDDETFVVEVGHDEHEACALGANQVFARHLCTITV